jgi:hypothetical protein
MTFAREWWARARNTKDDLAGFNRKEVKAAKEFLKNGSQDLPEILRILLENYH